MEHRKENPHPGCHLPLRFLGLFLFICGDSQMLKPEAESCSGSEVPGDLQDHPCCVWGFRHAEFPCPEGGPAACWYPVPHRDPAPSITAHSIPHKLPRTSAHSTQYPRIVSLQSIPSTQNHSTSIQHPSINTSTQYSAHSTQHSCPQHTVLQHK